MVAHYEREGIEGLKEKSGTSTGSKNGRPKKTKTLEEELLRLRAENALLKSYGNCKGGKSKETSNLPSHRSASRQLSHGPAV
ncbi:hypothetical protein [Paenibacillus sp. ISL-20]|uniref:hypothetical protein n=1 Tax=Paenibacillus sp. ISL-20 TaxID=2819163 RepID=UPI001BE62CE5|nr:hypothetical protein [Paenibacillus sp. ISL-20]MBT2760327.1 hypothetical protein [Paenibacillus sp. ISL-20]